MKFAIGITLYNPSCENIEYLMDMKELVSKIYVFDNSALNDTYKHYFHDERIEYSFNGKNEGLSKAFNWFLNVAYDDNIDFILLLDQDSMFLKSALTLLMDRIEGLPVRCRTEEVAMFACETIPCEYNQEVQRKGIYEAEQAISSGCSLNVKLLNKYNLRYDEKLFVDHVDFEFCSRVRKLDLKILVDDTYVLKQQLGYYYNDVICHSAVRHYYMVRDIGYVNEKSKAGFKAQLSTLRYFLTDVKICFKEDDTLKKIRYATKGYLDYLKRRTGEYKRD